MAQKKSGKAGLFASLRNKLLGWFLALSLLPLIVLGLTNFFITQYILQQWVNTLALVTAGLVVVTAILVTGVAWFVGRAFSTPIVRVTQAATAVAGGDLTQRAEVSTGDEIEQMATAFNRMADEMAELVGTLEERVAERAHHLEVAAALGERLSTILDFDQLLAEMVNRVKENFNYYHAHVYIIDDRRQNLVMTAGAGEAGEKMKVKRHSIPLNAPASLVARAARTGKIVRVDNVRKAKDWLPNPLLPDTYSEMAVPIMLGLEGQVVGVLDVQENEIAGLDESDANLLRSLAGQVAVALNNARLFQETQAAAAEVEELNRRLTHEVWRGIGDKIEMSGYTYTKSGIIPSATEWLPAMTEAVQQKNLAHRAGNGDDGSVQAQEATSVAIPLILRGEVIGVIGIERTAPSPARERREEGQKGGTSWSEDELVMVQAVTEQIALALDAARLTRDTERAAWRDQVVSESTARVWSSSEIEEVMKAAVTQLGDKLRASEVVIRLGTEAELKNE